MRNLSMTMCGKMYASKKSKAQSVGSKSAKM